MISDIAKKETETETERERERERGWSIASDYKVFPLLYCDGYPYNLLLSSQQCIPLISLKYVADGISVSANQFITLLTCNSLYL
jgi:hypothetical protein